MSRCKRKREVLKELRTILKRPELTFADMLEVKGKLSAIETNLDETVHVIHCPRAGAWVVMKVRKGEAA
jgi:hypothetical protein